MDLDEHARHRLHSLFGADAVEVFLFFCAPGQVSLLVVEPRELIVRWAEVWMLTNDLFQFDA